MHTVLVICADAATFEAIAQHFPPNGWMVERAADEDAALRVAAADPPDLAILHPSASNDPRTLQRLRLALEFADTPIIGLVGDDRQREVDQLLPAAPTPAIILPLPIANAPFHRAVQALVGTEAASSLPGAPSSSPESESESEPPSDSDAELFGGFSDLPPALSEALVLGEDELEASTELGSIPLDASEFEENGFEVEVIELAVGEPAGEDAEPGAVPPRLAGKKPPPPPTDPVALADTGEFPIGGEPATTGAAAPGPPYQRLLSRAIVRWEGEVTRVLGQRDKAREAFVRLRERAQSLDEERSRALDQLRRAGKEIVRLRGALRRRAEGGDSTESMPAAGLESTEALPAVAPPPEGAPPGPPPLPGAAARPTRPARAKAPPPLPLDLEGVDPAERLAQVIAELGEARDELDRAWQESDELTVRLGETEDRLRVAESAATAARAAAERAEQQLVAREESEEEVVNALEERERELGELRAELDGLQETYQSHTDELREAREALEERTGALEAVTTALEEARAALDETRGELDATKTRAAEAEESAAEAGATRERQLSELESLGQRLAQLEESLESARSDAFRWEGKASRLTASLDVARAEAESLREERERLLDDLSAAREQLRAAASQPGRRRPGGPAPLVVEVDAAEGETAAAAPVVADLGAEDELAEALRAADAALARSERRETPGGGPSTHAEEDRAARSARDEAFEAQRARVELLQMELEIAQQQLKEAQETANAAKDASLRADDRRIGAALALAENRLGELPTVRSGGQERQHKWQSLLTQIGVQMSQVLKACADIPAVRATGIKPEDIFQVLKTLATESASVFSDRRFILDREETVLRLMRDKLRDIQGLPPAQNPAAARVASGEFTAFEVIERRAKPADGRREEAPGPAPKA